MCLAVCGTVRKLDLPFAIIDIRGIETCINIELVEEPEIGDYVLVHAGFAIEKVDKEYFNYLDNALENFMKEDDFY